MGTAGDFRPWASGRRVADAGTTRLALSGQEEEKVKIADIMTSDVVTVGSSNLHNREPDPRPEAFGILSGFDG
jgi:hypothetical protein